MNDGAIGIVFSKDRKKVLLVKRRDVPAWVLPGGGIEKGETPEKTCIREVLEESGYKVKIIKQIAEYSYKGSKNISHLFLCQILSGKARISSESKEVTFFNLNNLPNPHHPIITQCLKDYKLKKKGIIKKEIEVLKLKKVFGLVFKYPVTVFRYLLLKVGLRINT